MAAGTELTPTEYIGHHLTHATKPLGDGGFWTLHLDSLARVDPARRRRAWASSGGWCAARPRACRASARRSSSCCSTSSTSRRKASSITATATRSSRPLALTVFVWVLLMNAMDFLPVDIVALGHAHAVAPHGFRIVPTADVNTTFALALSVWLLMIFFSIAVKGLGGWMHELFCSPFGAQPAAVALQLPVQLHRVHLQAAVALAAALRQHVRGRDHLPAAVDVGGDRPRRDGLRLRCSALGWAIFHILIVVLQAYIFMMLTIVYISMAHEHH